jgi:outer membrane receptor protein involved in Fe transport
MHGARAGSFIGPASLQVAAGVWILMAGALTRAVAQSADAASGPLAEILVTATKRESLLLETPINMTVIGPDILETANIDAVADFERLIPGLTAIDSGPGQKRYALRGLQSAGGPEVALYYDDIPISGLPGSTLDTGADQPDLKLWDTDRIEVLRGPQGTLYGNGSMGGAIRILSRRPDLSNFSAAADSYGATTQGGTSSWGASAMLNAPIVEERFAVRATFYDRHNGGWLDQTYRSDIALHQNPGDNLNWEHTWGSRVSATFQASDQWTITGIAYYQKLQTGNSFETYPSFAVPGNPYVTESFVRTPWNDQTAMLDLTSTYDLDWVSVVAIGTYQNRIVDQSLDTTRFLLGQFGCNESTWDQSCFGPPLVPAVSYAHEGVHAYSGELRLVSRRPGRLQWVAGAFLQRASTYHHAQVAVADSDGYIAIDPSTGIANNRLFARTNYDHFDQDALYGEGTYDLYRGLKATVGLRRFHSYQSDQQNIEQQFFPGQPTGSEPFQRFSESKLFKKIELSYMLTPSTLLYTQVAQGFRAGGPNYPGGFTATAPPYSADSVWDTEMGWKTALKSGRFFWTGAMFHIDWSNMQQLVPTQLFNYIINAGSAHSDGFESEFEIHPSQRLSLSLGASYADARLIGPQPQSSNPAMQLMSGDPLGGVSKWTTNASASYTMPLREQRRWVARLDYSYQSSRPTVTAIESPAYFMVGGGGLTALHLLFENPNSWSLGLHVTNLFNDFVPLSGTTLDSNFIKTVTAAAPRTVLLNLTARF